MPQTSDIYFPYTVNETVLLGTYASAGNSFFGTDAKAAQFANKCMEDCDVLDLKERHLDELSGVFFLQEHSRKAHRSCS